MWGWCGGKARRRRRDRSLAERLQAAQAEGARVRVYAPQRVVPALWVDDPQAEARAQAAEAARALMAQQDARVAAERAAQAAQSEAAQEARERILMGARQQTTTGWNGGWQAQGPDWNEPTQQLQPVRRARRVWPAEEEEPIAPFLTRGQQAYTRGAIAAHQQRPVAGGRRVR